MAVPGSTVVQNVMEHNRALNHEQTLANRMKPKQSFQL